MDKEYIEKALFDHLVEDIANFYAKKTEIPKRLSDLANDLEIEGATPEEIEAAVKAYLKENPVTPENCVLYVAQSLTATQKKQARTNIGAISINDLPESSNLTVDSEISSTSTNPVQNKVIKAYIDAIVGDIETAMDSINAIVGGE